MDSCGEQTRREIALGAVQNPPTRGAAHAVARPPLRRLRAPHPGGALHRAAVPPPPPATCPNAAAIAADAVQRSTSSSWHRKTSTGSTASPTRAGPTPVPRRAPPPSRSRRARADGGGAAAGHDAAGCGVVVAVRLVLVSRRGRARPTTCALAPLVVESLPSSPSHPMRAATGWSR